MSMLVDIIDGSVKLSLRKILGWKCCWGGEGHLTRSSQLMEDGDTERMRVATAWRFKQCFAMIQAFT